MTVPNHRVSGAPMVPVSGTMRTLHFVTCKPESVSIGHVPGEEPMDDASGGLFSAISQAHS